MAPMVIMVIILALEITSRSLGKGGKGRDGEGREERGRTGGEGKRRK